MVLIGTAGNAHEFPQWLSEWDWDVQESLSVVFVEISLPQL